MRQEHPDSGPGLVATVMGALLTIIFFLSLMAFNAPASTLVTIALVGAVMLGSGIGIILAVLGFFQRERRRAFPVIGLLVNGLLFFSIVAAIALEWML